MTRELSGEKGSKERDSNVIASASESVNTFIAASEQESLLVKDSLLSPQ